jgi:hypothetical protein
MRHAVEDFERRYFEDAGRLNPSTAQSNAGLELSLIRRFLLDRKFS